MNGEYSINHPCGIPTHIILYFHNKTNILLHKLNEKSNKSSDTGRKFSFFKYKETHKSKNNVSRKSYFVSYPIVCCQPCEHC